MSPTNPSAARQEDGGCPNLALFDQGPRVVREIPYRDHPSRFPPHRDGVVPKEMRRPGPLPSLPKWRSAQPGTSAQMSQLMLRRRGLGDAARSWQGMRLAKAQKEAGARRSVGEQGQQRLPHWLLELKPIPLD